MGGPPNMRCSDQVEAGGLGSEVTPKAEPKRYKFIEYLPREQRTRTTKGETACKKAVVRGHKYRAE